MHTETAQETSSELRHQRVRSKPSSLDALRFRIAAIRNDTVKLCEPLEPEDHVIQPMTEVSPPKWHLAHTTWFFEEFILKRFVEDYRPFHPQYDFLFNSYYESVGARLNRDDRGLLSRPTIEEIHEYRHYVDTRLAELIDDGAESERHGEASDESIKSLLEALVLGLHHEQQHQELLLSDIKNIMWSNPLRPAYVTDPLPQEACASIWPSPQGAALSTWLSHSGGIVEIGHDGSGFGFDNERPKHKVYLEPFSISERLVTCREYLEFIDDGGYSRPSLWLSDGWVKAQQLGWKSPLYWERDGQNWFVMTLSGMKKLNLAEAVCHVSYYEADAFARWKNLRLPTEFEWEAAVASGLGPMAQVLQTVWQWTSSAYLPYPGFKPLDGAFGEYNGKFMCNQMVLRGGSWATPASHRRVSYRNFFQPESRWPFTGFRLARW